MDNETQQIVVTSFLVASFAVILAGLAIWFALSARRVQSVSAKDYDDFLVKLRALGDLDKRTDRVIIDAVSSHLRSALGSSDSAKVLATTLISHPLFLNQLVSTLSDTLKDSSNTFGDVLIEKIVEAVGDSGITPEVRAKIVSLVSANVFDRVPGYLEDYDTGDKIVQKVVEAVAAEMPPDVHEKLRTAIGDHIKDGISDLLSDDDDLQNSIINALEERLPAFVKELFDSDEKFRTSVQEAIVGVVNSHFENN